MPAPGWKSVNIEDDVHELLVILASDLRRSVAWTANRILETAVRDCLDSDNAHPRAIPALQRDRAEKYGVL